MKIYQLKDQNDKNMFRMYNKNNWEKNSKFWIDQYYIHLGLREKLFSYLKDFILNYQNKFNHAPKILDIGCGSGWLVDDLLRTQLNFNYTGLDYISNFTDFLTNKYHDYYQSINFVNLDIEVIPETFSESYDLIISNFTLHEIVFPEVAFKNIYKLMNKEAHLLIISLDATIEVIRVLDAESEILENLLKVFRSDMPTVISKPIIFNKNISIVDYQRILYTYSDFVDYALREHLTLQKSGYVNDYDRIRNNPVYLFIEFIKE